MQPDNKNRILIATNLVLIVIIFFLYIFETIFPPSQSDYLWRYKVTTSSIADDHSYYTAALEYDGYQLYYNKWNNKVIQNLNFTYFFLSSEHLVVKITDLDNPDRWEVPNEAPFPHADYSNKLAPYTDALVEVTVTEDPFTFKVTRKSTGEVIFDTSAGNFIYSDYYIQISTTLATPNIYGFGERAAKLNLRPNGTYTLFNKDAAWTLEDGTSGHNLYGYHPVYLQREESNSFSTNLLRSSVPMDVQIKDGEILTYKVLGGVLDFHFFLGTNEDAKPETVMKQYHDYLGKWTLQPFWSFGYHQCRWKYRSIFDLTNVLSKFQEHELPMDVIWSDIDYMNNYIDFTINERGFPSDKMRSMIATYKKRWVPIIDAGVAIGNDIHKIGADSDVYIKNPDGTALQGKVWPGIVNYPDFFHPNTSKFWSKGLNMLHEKVPFSGIWLDMNEVSNFVSGSTNFYNDYSNLLNNPPYKTTSLRGSMYEKTIRLDAVHYGDIKEFYVHNTFGLLESKATYDYLKTVNDLAFILTRSSFYGSGQYAAHWTGDNAATYEWLALSIPTVINSGFFGMPMAGADICGFHENTTPELCARWYQLGSLYPFSRNHNDDQGMSQEPYVLGPTVLQTAKVTLALRYSTVRHYYTQFLRQNGTGTIFRPVFFEFPTNQNFYQDNSPFVDSQFLIGESLLVAPALQEDQSRVSVYFPKDTWFDFITGKLVQSSDSDSNIIEYPAPLNATAPIFIRGGYIIPTQDVTGVMRTDDLSNKYQLNIAFKHTDNKNYQTAKGELVGISNFEDSNVLKKCREGNCLYTVQAAVILSDNSYDMTVTFTAQGDASSYESVQITGFLVMGDFGGDAKSTGSHSFAGIVNNSTVNGEVKVEAKSNNLVKYIFDKPVDINPGVTMKMSGARN